MIQHSTSMHHLNTLTIDIASTAIAPTHLRDTRAYYSGGPPYSDAVPRALIRLFIRGYLSHMYTTSRAVRCLTGFPHD